MSDASEQVLLQAIHTISQSDPITKLLQEVKLGRMKPTDAGLRAITEAWLSTYQTVIETAQLNRDSLRRLDPSSRLDVLIAAGVLTTDHAGAGMLKAAFEKVLSSAE